MKNNRPITVLSIAGSDNSAGAGIQADLKTIAALGGYAFTVLTASTAQNTVGVKDIHLLPPEHIAKQLQALEEDCPIDAIKIGMLGNLSIIKIIQPFLELYHTKNIPIVLDPVLVSTSGKALLEEQAILTLVKEIFPLCTLITPNLPEYERIKALYPSAHPHSVNFPKKVKTNVLLKGGHGMQKTYCEDILLPLKKHAPVHFKHDKIDTKNSHGTGCTLSSAIAFFLGEGKSLEEAVRNGIEFTHHALKKAIGLELGKGHGPLQHFSNKQ